MDVNFRQYYGAYDRLKAELKDEFHSGKRAWNEKPVVWIDYPMTRTILLNGCKTLARLQFEGQNDLVFSYLFDNPYRIISVKELEAEAVRGPLDKTLHEFMRAFGFTGALRTLFFDVSNKKILFRRQLYQNDLQPYEVFAPMFESISRLTGIPFHSDTL